MVGGAAVAIIGAIFSITGIGAIIGIPMIFVGVAIMFPRFAVVMAILAAVAFISLLMVL